MASTSNVEFSIDAMMSKVSQSALGGSAIRKMFTLGQELRDKFGEDNVFDFSIGNPALEPPKEFQEALLAAVNDKTPMNHGYTANQGLLECRAAVATLITKMQGVTIDADHVFIECGAAGAMNVVFHTILNPGDEVISLVPFFLEYAMYTQIHGGVLVKVPTLPNYDPDLAAIAKAITPRTKALIINSPNNPTGRVYSQQIVNDLGKLLLEKSIEIGHPIYLVSDDPYARLVYDGAHAHSTFQAYKFSFVVSSYSKDLSIPGERLGYIGAHPSLPHWPELKAALTQWTRALGYVNAPVVMQRTVARCALACVDVNWYKEKRDILCKALIDSGLELGDIPAGAFYAFPRVPAGYTAEEFTEALATKNVLCVPGTPFGMPHNVRFCFAVSLKTVTNAVPIIKEVVSGLIAKRK